MKKHVIIAANIYDESTWSHADVDDVLAYIKHEFTFIPDTLQIYHNVIAESNNVTPLDDAGRLKLESLTGKFFVVIRPAFLEAVNWIFGFAVQSASNWIVKQFMPAAPQAAGSPNNELAARQNGARINGRIPYICGTVRSTPDLIALPYTYYDDAGKEIENCVMCVGVGAFQVHDCRDGDTQVNDIVGTSVSIYDPNTDITGAPIYQVGDTFTDAPLYTKKSSAINGQSLDAPNERKLQSTNLYFEYPNLIKSRVAVDFSAYFAVNDGLVIYGAQLGIADINLSGNATVDTGYKISFESSLNINNPGDFKGLLLTAALFNISGTYIDLSGQFDVASIVKTTILGGFKYEITLSSPQLINPKWSTIAGPETASVGASLNKNTGTIVLDETYTIESISSTQIALINPSAINADWEKVNNLPGHSTVALIADIALDRLDSRWVGWHSIVMPEATGMLINLVYPEGLYWASRSGRIDPQRSGVTIEYQMVDTDGNPVGGIFKHDNYLYQIRRNGFGISIKIDLPYAGSFRFRVCRWTALNGDPQAKDLVKIKDVYGYTASTKTNYGNATIVRSRTIATDGALAVKERKLNMLVTHKFPLNVTGPLTPTRSAADAIVQMAIDPHIGRRTLAEVDYVQIYQTIADINAYFGTSDASEFCYTFDNYNMSFEESINTITSAIFCEPYRRGNSLKLNFERENLNSVLLFNHRNKIPKSETRELQFGIQNNYDGVVVEYTDSTDDSRIKLFLPNESATNPQSITTAGVRNKRQAHLIAYRAYNKQRYQREFVQFDAMRESDLLVRRDRVLVADNTRNTTQDGQVEQQAGLIIITSQPCKFEPGHNYIIHLQLYEGSVDAIGCSAGIDEYQVQLARAPLMPLVTDDDRAIKTAYVIISDEDITPKAFILTEKEVSSRDVNTLSLINYDDRYYQNDHDFNNFGHGFNHGFNHGGVV